MKNPKVPDWTLEIPPYRTEIRNGKEIEYDFKNVFISYKEDPDSFLIAHRVNKSTENQDLFEALLIANAPRMYTILKMISETQYRTTKQGKVEKHDIDGIIAIATSAIKEADVSTILK